MTFWEWAGLLCLASILIPLVTVFVVRFKMLAHYWGERAVREERAKDQHGRSRNWENN